MTLEHYLIAGLAIALVGVFFWFRDGELRLRERLSSSERYAEIGHDAVVKREWEHYHELCRKYAELRQRLESLERATGFAWKTPEATGRHIDKGGPEQSV